MRNVFCCYDNIEFFNQSIKLQAFNGVGATEAFPFSPTIKDLSSRFYTAIKVSKMAQKN